MSQQPRIIKDDDLTLGQIFLLAFKKWITFKGRASRYQYWPFILIIFVVDKIFDPFIGNFFLSELYLGHWYHWFWFGPCCIFLIFIGIATVSLSARRLHDVNMPGWIILPLTVFLIIKEIFSEAGILLMVLGIPLGVLGLIIFIVSFFKGTKGPNKYGPDPKDDVEWETRGIFKKGAFKNAKKWILRVTIVLTLVAGSITGIILSMGYFEKRKSDAFIENMAPGSFFTLKIDDSSKNPYTFGKVQNIDEENIYVQLSNYNYSHLGNTEADMNKAKATGDDLSSPITFSRKEFQDLNIQSVG